MTMGGRTVASSTEKKKRRQIDGIEHDIALAHQFKLLRRAVDIFIRVFPGNKWLPKLKVLLDWFYETDISDMGADAQMEQFIAFMYSHMTTEGAKRAVVRDLKKPRN